MINKEIDAKISEILDQVDRIISSDVRGKHSVLLHKDGKILVISGKYEFRIEDPRKPT